MTQAPPLDDSENWAASSSCIVGRCLSVHLGIRSRVSWTPTLTIPAERASAGVYMSHSMRGEGAAPGIDLHLHLVGAQRLAAHAGAKGLVEAADVEVALLPRRGASGVRSSTRESQDNGIAALQQCQLMIASWAARQRRAQRGEARPSASILGRAWEVWVVLMSRDGLQPLVRQVRAVDKSRCIHIQAPRQEAGPGLVRPAPKRAPLRL